MAVAAVVGEEGRIRHHQVLPASTRRRGEQERMVVLEVSSARLGATSIAGGEQRSEAMVSAIRMMEAKGSRFGSFHVFYNAPRVCCW
jgi:hypothetical protein